MSFLSQLAYLGGGNEADASEIYWLKCGIVVTGPQFARDALQTNMDAEKRFVCILMYDLYVCCACTSDRTQTGGSNWRSEALANEVVLIFEKNFVV